MADFTDGVKQFLQAADGYPVALVTCTFTCLLLIWAFLFITPSHRYVSRFPVIEPTQKGQLSASFSAQGAEMIARGLKTRPGLFQVMTGTGPVVVLPNRFADEIRNSKSLSFNRYFDKDFFVNYPGFEAYRTGYKDGTFIQEVVRTKLTQSLGLVTQDLVDEMTDACQCVLGHDAQFHEIYVKQATSRIVAKLSSRVFLGKNLARNDKWLRIAASYTHDSYSAAHELRQWTVFLRPFVFSFLPNLRRLRREVQEATSLIMPEVALRKAVVDKALAAGQKAPKSADAIGWMHEISRGRQVNYVHGQLFLSFAAIHTTTETITSCLFDICYYPHIVQPLREEIIQVLGQEGWSRTALHKLKLMDSFMKESQRRHPMGTTSMHRHADEDIQLSDGSLIKKGTRVMVSASTFMDPEVYPDPEKYDIYRFYNLRNTPGQENAYQYVQTSADHLIFGHGSHACPGRFFASNEMKIALCFLLLNYDWKLCGGQTARPNCLKVDQGSLTDPSAKVMVRARKAEIDLTAGLE